VLRYVRHDIDIIIDSKLSGIHFCCFRGEKDKLYTKTARISS